MHGCVLHRKGKFNAIVKNHLLTTVVVMKQLPKKILIIILVCVIRGILKDYKYNLTLSNVHFQLLVELRLSHLLPARKQYWNDIAYSYSESY